MAQLIPRSAFVRAMRGGDVAAMEHYIEQPHVMEAATRAESWLVTQGRDTYRWACLVESHRAYLADRLGRALQTAEHHDDPVWSGHRCVPACECVWFMSNNRELELYSFESREAEYDAVAWLLTSPLTETTPQTIKWMLSIFIFAAVQHGNCELLELVLESVVFRDQYQGDGTNQLLEHVACAWAKRSIPQKNAEDVANVLLTHGAGIEFLQAKVELTRVEFCRFLLAQGAHLVGLDQCARGWNDTVPDVYLQLLVLAGADPRAGGPFTWHRAIRFGSVNTVKMLVDEWCADLDARLADVCNCTPLMLAVSRQDAAVAEVLLDKGADMTLTDTVGRTALAYAASNGNASVIELLLTHGADPNAVDAYGESILDHAKRRRKPDANVAKVLEQFGIN